MTSTAIEGPAYVGNYSRIGAEAAVGPYSVLGSSVTLRDGARTTRTVIDSSTHIGRSSIIEGAILGRSCDIRSHVHINEGVAIGDEVTIGAESVVMPDVRIYPYKEVESGSQIFESLIWESRASSRLFGKEAVSGLVNVDLTPEVAVRLASALGTALKRGARVVASRESPAACRMIKRAMISGLNSTGIDVADLRVLPAAVNRHLLKTEGYDVGLHVGTRASDPEVVEIRFFEQPGIQLTPALQKEIEKHFTRQELRRAAAGNVGAVGYPARVRESYALDLVSALDVEAIRARRFRLVVDYSYSASSFVLPLVLGPLGVEAVAAHGFSADRPGEAQEAADALDQSRRLVSAASADVGAVLDRAGERLYLIDELGNEIAPEKALLLFLRLLAGSGREGRVAFPVTTTALVEKMVAGSTLEVVRTRASLADLTAVAAEPGVVFAGAGGGGYVFPEFLPAYDAVASLCKLLELLAPDRAAALRARRRPAELDARPPHAPLPVVAEGPRHAAPHRAAQGAGDRSHGRDQADREGRLGDGAGRSGRAARPHLRRGRHRRGVGTARGGDAHDDRRDHGRRRERAAARRPSLKLRLTLPGSVALLRKPFVPK